jgi:hypothetical protein
VSPPALAQTDWTPLPSPETRAGTRLFAVELFPNRPKLRLAPQHQAPPFATAQEYSYPALIA